jgi:hypothetical protein
MSTLITILHVIVCLFLMLTVLLQAARGGMGRVRRRQCGDGVRGSGASSFLSPHGRGRDHLHADLTAAAFLTSHNACRRARAVRRAAEKPRKKPPGALERRHRLGGRGRSSLDDGALTPPIRAAAGDKGRAAADPNGGATGRARPGPRRANPDQAKPGARASPRHRRPEPRRRAAPTCQAPSPAGAAKTPDAEGPDNVKPPRMQSRLLLRPGRHIREPATPARHAPPARAATARLAARAHARRSSAAWSADWALLACGMRFASILARKRLPCRRSARPAADGDAAGPTRHRPLRPQFGSVATACSGPAVRADAPDARAQQRRQKPNVRQRLRCVAKKAVRSRRPGSPEAGSTPRRRPVCAIDGRRRRLGHVRWHTPLSRRIPMTGPAGSAA